jgi:7-carboxy-7-deazaguanine synthase
MIIISEIFYSLQGESTKAGKLCVFIRLAGCNLHCKWCDTEYANYPVTIKQIPKSNLQKNTYMSPKLFSIEEIIAKVQQYNCNFVEITGGEPLIQDESKELANRLIELGYEVAVETNGSVLLADLDTAITKIMDIKCPSSGMDKNNLYENINYLNKKDEIKFVIASKDDFYWSIEVINRYKLYERTDNILFSAVSTEIKYNDLAELVLSIKDEEIKKVVRMQLQLHKVIWGNEIGR